MYDKNLASGNHNIIHWDFSKFNIAYCGSIRQANCVNKICEAAKELFDQGDRFVHFHIYGNGDELEALEKYVKDNAIDNVSFYGRFKKNDIPTILSHSKVNILSYKQVGLMKYGGSQSKLFDYLASGKPILCNSKWGFNLIERYNCGIVTKDQTALAFVESVQSFLAMSQLELEEMGKRARSVAEMYDQPILVDKLCNVFDYVLSIKKRRKK